MEPAEPTFVSAGSAATPLDAQLGARDLGLYRDEPLPHLRRRRVDLNQRLAVLNGRVTRAVE